MTMKRYKYVEWASGHCAIVDTTFEDTDDRYIVIRCDSLFTTEVERIQEVAKLIGADGI